MKRLAIILALLASPVAADRFDDALSDLEMAAERCESAWFQRTRKAALDDVVDARQRLLLASSPFAGLSRADEARRDMAIEASERCLCLTYPDSISC